MHHTMYSSYLIQVPRKFLIHNNNYNTKYLRSPVHICHFHYEIVHKLMVYKLWWLRDNGEMNWLYLQKICYGSQRCSVISLSALGCCFKAMSQSITVIPTIIDLDCYWALDWHHFPATLSPWMQFASSGYWEPYLVIHSKQGCCELQGVSAVATQILRLCMCWEAAVKSNSKPSLCGW